MRLTENKIPVCLALLLITAGILLSGCARSPWTGAIEGERRTAIEAAFLASIDDRSQCVAGLESELVVTWKTPTQTYSFAGYCQLLEPSYLKLAVSSPLGLPLLVIATNGQRYQFLDAVKKSSITGDIDSWAKQNNIPPALVHSSWVGWITGGAVATPSQIAEIRLDERNRGAWLKIDRSETDNITKEYILFDSESGKILERMIVDDLGKIHAIISYERWQQGNDCPRPVEILITGLPYNASAELLFTNIEPSNLAPDSFILAVPVAFESEMRP